jgi:hypothetical protein
VSTYSVQAGGAHGGSVLYLGSQSRRGLPHTRLMETITKLVRERHVDWTPILDMIHSESGAAAVESMNGFLSMVG